MSQRAEGEGAEAFPNRWMRGRIVLFLQKLLEIRTLKVTTQQLICFREKIVFFRLPQNVFFWKVFKGFFGGFKKHTLEVSQTGFF